MCCTEAWVQLQNPASHACGRETVKHEQLNMQPKHRTPPDARFRTEEGAARTKEVGLGRATDWTGGELGQKELCARISQDTLKREQTDQADPAQGSGTLS